MPREDTQFKEGYDPRRHVKQKGETSFKKDFEIACKEMARALRLGKEPEKLKIEILKVGIREALKGKFPFWARLMEYMFGKPKEEIEFKRSLELEKLIEIERKAAEAISDEELRFRNEELNC